MLINLYLILFFIKNIKKKKHKNNGEHSFNKKIYKKKYFERGC